MPRIQKRVIRLIEGEQRVSSGEVSLPATIAMGGLQSSIPELMVIRSRQGKGVISQLESHPKVELLKDSRDRLDRSMDSIRPTQRKKSKIKFKELKVKWDDRYKRKSEILQILEEGGDGKLTTPEILAVLAVRHGIDSDSLKPWVSDYNNLVMTGIIKGGKIPMFLSALKDDVPARALTILEETGTHMSGEELADKLGYSLDVSQSQRNSTLNKINGSLNLLDLINRVVKLPKDTSRIRWIHPKQRYSQATIPEWNLKYRILKVIRDHPEILQIDIGKDPSIVSFFSRSSPKTDQESQHLSRLLSDDLSDLRRFGLITAEEKKVGPSHLKTRVYGLTPEAEEWMGITDREGRLHEDLRKALLGEHQIGLTEKQLDMLKRIKLWGKIRKSIRNNPDMGPESLVKAEASLQGISPRYVQNVRTGERPWGPAKKETLEVFRPYVSKEEWSEIQRSFEEQEGGLSPHQRHMLQRVKKWIEMRRVIEENPGAGSRRLATILNRKDEEWFTEPGLSKIYWTERPFRRTLVGGTPWVTKDIEELRRIYNPHLNKSQRTLFKEFTDEKLTG
ncbi:MAG: hypothetical protein ABH950_00175 [Candidatus Altiarchaeota archaeon]